MPVLLPTERLLLREYRREDLPCHHRLLSDAKAMYFIQDLQTTTLAESEENLRQAMQAAEESPRQKLFLVVADRQTDRYMGSMGYTVEEATPAGGIAYAGYFLLPEHQGRGYASEAFAALLDYGFGQGGLWRMNTECFARNVASERVMQKCGLKKEGHFEQRAWLDGAMEDRLAYRMLRPEWQAMQAGQAGF